jgi:hypothetical protein
MISKKWRLFGFEKENFKPAKLIVNGDLVVSRRSCRFLFGALEETIQTRSSNTQHLRGPDAVAFTGIQHAPNMLAANFLQWDRPPGISVSARAGLLQVLRQIVHVNEFIDGG